MTPARRRRRRPVPEPPPRPAERPGPERPNPERLYTISGEDGARLPLDLVTLIVADGDPPPSATPEQAALLRLCSAPLSVAELSAYLGLPFSVVSALLTELLAAEQVQARAPIVRQALPDRSLLEAVMHGLQRL
jgi:predicted Rossmann fold nucleotide-binding protein DprA/Smf involved in DNA uptake